MLNLIVSIFAILVFPAPTEPSPPASVPMREMIELFRVDRSDLERFYDVPSSRFGESRRRAFLEEWSAELGKIDFPALGREDQVDYLLLRNEIEHQVRGLVHRDARISELERIAPFATAIVELEESRGRMESIDPVVAAETLVRIAKEAAAARHDLSAAKKQQGPADASAADASAADTSAADASSPDASAAETLSPAAAKRLASTIRSSRRTLRHWFDYHDGYDPLFSWWCRAPMKKAEEAIDALADSLQKDVAGLRGGDDDPMVGDPIGRDALLDDLRHERIPYSPEELVDIGEREFVWCEAEMRRASNDLGFGDDWKQAIEHVKQLHVAPGGQDDLIRELAQEAVAFLDARDLVTIPDLCRETWRIEMMSPARQKVAPFFLYGGQQIIVSYPTDEMSHEEKLMSMRANSTHYSRATVQHELIPGHHLQGFMASRYRTHRRMFSTPFLGEGWALYWEMRLWDLEFPRGPEDRVGMLFWRMHRCARILVSLGFHLETMTPPEMIDLLVDRVGHERDSATAEVRRYIGDDYSPLYQCAYLIGGLQLRALHDELVVPEGMTERDFHDTILRQNSIPIEMIRAMMTDVPLTATHPPSWRFYDR